MADSNRQDEIRAVHKKHRLFYQLLGGAVILVVGILIGGFLFADKDGYAMNVVTEGFGVAVSVLITVLVIDRLNERRDEQRRIEELKQRLVREAGSRSNDVAIAAIEQLCENGWLKGKSGLLKKSRLRSANLRGVNLSKANLQSANCNEVILRHATLDNARFRNALMIDADLRGAHATESDWRRAKLWNAQIQESCMIAANFTNADLSCANLQGADLRAANLKGTKFYRSNLCGADLGKVDLRGAWLWLGDFSEANLWSANLQGADMFLANLSDAILVAADLKGADIRCANLQGAQLFEPAFIDERLVQQNAILPDGTEYSNENDLRRFTDRDHPEYNATVRKINEIRRELRYKPLFGN